MQRIESHFVIIYKKKSKNAEQLVDFLTHRSNGEIKYGYAYTKVNDDNMKEIDPKIDEDDDIWDCVSMDGSFTKPFRSGKEMESFIESQGIEDSFLKYDEDWRDLDSNLMKSYLGKNPESVTLIQRPKFDPEWLCQFVNDLFLKDVYSDIASKSLNIIAQFLDYFEAIYNGTYLEDLDIVTIPFPQIKKEFNDMNAKVPEM